MLKTFIITFFIFNCFNFFLFIFIRNVITN